MKFDPVEKKYIMCSRKKILATVYSFREKAVSVFIDISEVVKSVWWEG